MVVNVTAIPQPYLELSLVAWWTLTVWQEYFFIWFHQCWYWYYGNAVSQASVQHSIIPTTWMQSIKIKNWSRRWNITSTADAWSWYTTISVDNLVGVINFQTVEIKGTTSYDWIHTITSLWPNTFNINVAYVADETGVSLHTPWRASDILAHHYGITYKWDKYSMMRPDGSYYRRNNLNDPYHASHTEDYWTYWHRKRTHWYYYQGDNSSERVFTEERASYQSYALNDWLVIGTVVVGMLRHPEIAQRISVYPCYEGFNMQKGRLLITTDTDWATRDTLIDALQASWHDDMFILTNDYIHQSAVKNLFLNAHFQYVVGGALFKFEDFNLTLLWWQLDHWAYMADVYRWFTTTIWTQSSSWLNDRNNYIDTQRNHVWSSFIMDNVKSDNSWFQWSMTWYAKQVDWFNLIGWYPWAVLYFQWRYIRNVANCSMKNMYIKNYYIYFSNSWWTDQTGIMDNVQFINTDLNPTYPYDVQTYRAYQTAHADYIMECKDVICDTVDWKIRLLANAMISDPYDFSDTWNMRFWINLTILDKDWLPIENADIKLERDTGEDTGITDIDWLSSVVWLSYTMYVDNFDRLNTSKYYEASDYKELKLTITKEGYKTYELDNIVIKEWKDRTIALTIDPPTTWKTVEDYIDERLYQTAKDEADISKTDALIRFNRYMHRIENYIAHFIMEDFYDEWMTIDLDDGENLYDLPIWDSWLAELEEFPEFKKLLECSIKYDWVWAGNKAAELPDWSLPYPLEWYKTNQPSTAPYFRFDNKKLRIYPTPTQDVEDGLVLRYARSEVDVLLTTNEKDMTVPRQHIPVILKWMTYQLKKTNSDVWIIKTYKKDWEDALDGMVKDVGDRYAQPWEYSNPYLSNLMQ